MVNIQKYLRVILDKPLYKFWYMFVYKLLCHIYNISFVFLQVVRNTLSAQDTFGFIDAKFGEDVRRNLYLAHLEPFWAKHIV